MLEYLSNWELHHNSLRTSYSFVPTRVHGFHCLKITNVLLLPLNWMSASSQNRLASSWGILDHQLSVYVSKYQLPFPPMFFVVRLGNVNNGSIVFTRSWDLHIQRPKVPLMTCAMSSIESMSSKTQEYT
jgi:hypothetical protein